MLAPDQYGSLSILEVAAESLRRFTCGKASLDGFLRDAAQDFHKDRLGFTKLVFHADWDGPVGYFTLSNDSIPLNPSESNELGLVDHVTLGAFPAVKLARLAVQKDTQGIGVGSAIMRLILGEVLDLESRSAARLLVTDADNDDAVLRFYRKHGFVDSLWAQDQRRNRSNRTGRSQTTKMHRDILQGL